MRILMLNGPNLNLLGRREPDKYGSRTLADIEAEMTALAASLGLELTCRQDNYEGGLVEKVQRAEEEGFGGIVLNAGGYTHTSVALRDSVLAAGLPVVEVHLTNPHAREDFRRRSLLAGAAVGAIAGFGAESYALALHWFARRPSEA